MNKKFALAGGRVTMAILGLLLWAGAALALTVVSGTVTSPVGHTGRLYLKVEQAMGGETSAGTSVNLTSTSTSYTIHGLTYGDGDYVVRAYLDEAGNAVPYDNAARGKSATFTVTNGVASGPADLAISFRTPPPTPALASLSVMPGDGAMLIFVKPALNAQSDAKADHFSLCYADNVGFNNPTCPTAFTNLPVISTEENMLALNGLTNGATIYFQATPYYGTTAGAVVSGSGTPNSPTGGHTVSGMVHLNFSGTPPPAGASVYVVMLNDKIPGVVQPTILGKQYTLPNGATTLPFSITGVPDGYFFVYTLVDLNANGVVDIGDPMATEGSLAPLVNVVGQDLNDVSVVVTDTPMTTVVKSQHNLAVRTTFNQTETHSYDLNFECRDNAKRPAAVTLTSGPQGTMGPFDIARSSYGNYYTYLDTNGIRPQPSDVYNFQVTYTDGTTASVGISPTTILDSFPTAPITPSGYILDNRPNFNWSAPANPPQPLYNYYLSLLGKTNGVPSQLYPAGFNQQDYLLPSSTTTLAYPLTANLNYDEKYLYQISVFDLLGNQATVYTEFTPVTKLPAPVQAGIGAYYQGNWYLDKNANGVWDPGTDFNSYFGDAQMIPVTGDWNGDGYTEVGAYNNGTWYLDMNGNGIWDGEPTDKMIPNFGYAGALPVTGDWNGDKVTEIGIYDPNTFTWYLDNNGNGTWDGTPTDTYVPNFGFAGVLPVVGDWNSNGHDKIGVYSNGQWYLDANGNFSWDGTPTDTMVANFGFAGALPVVGDWTGSGVDRLGVYYNGQWYLDTNGNFAWDGSPTDTYAPDFGFAGASPMVGVWR